MLPFGFNFDAVRPHHLAVSASPKGERSCVR
jgi:hypothetical protein